MPLLPETCFTATCHQIVIVQVSKSSRCIWTDLQATMAVDCIHVYVGVRSVPAVHISKLAVNRSAPSADHRHSNCFMNRQETSEVAVHNWLRFYRERGLSFSSLHLHGCDACGLPWCSTPTLVFRSDCITCEKLCTNVAGGA